MRRIVPFLCAAFIIGWATIAFGATIEDLYGDKDGFDRFLLNDGSVDFNDNFFLNNPRDEGKTDFPTGRSDLPLKWTHTYDCSRVGTITSVTLEIFAAGQGENLKVYIDDQYAGTLTKSETWVTGKTVNYAKRDIIELSPSLFYLLDGELQIRIGDPLGDNDKADNFALDYGVLTITSEPINTPVPPSIVLLGSGLIGLITLGRKRSQSPIH